MFLVTKLFSHLSIGYASLTILLPWIKHKQHQNHSKSKTFQNQNFNSHKLCIQTITLYKWRCFSRSQTPSHILIKRKLIKKPLKVYPPHGSPNNQKEKKSHGSPCDFTINHKETISHGSLCDCTINHKKTISHGAHDISQCTMTKLWNPIIQLTPLNNYLNNCVITSSYTSKCSYIVTKVSHASIKLTLERWTSVFGY
jgi:hypothetical protein